MSATYHSRYVVLGPLVARRHAEKPLPLLSLIHGAMISGLFWTLLTVAAAMAVIPPAVTAVMPTPRLHPTPSTAVHSSPDSSGSSGSEGSSSGSVGRLAAL